MPANLSLELREEFRSGHMRGTAIELRNRQNTGWAQRDPGGLLGITYPTTDVQHALAAISTKALVVGIGDKNIMSGDVQAARFIKFQWAAGSAGSGFTVAGHVGDGKRGGAFTLAD